MRYPELLVTAGVDNVRELRNRNAENPAAKKAEAATRNRQSHTAPS
jgi:hypothetical protein